MRPLLHSPSKPARYSFNLLVIVLLTCTTAQAQQARSKTLHWDGKTLSVKNLSEAEIAGLKSEKSPQTKVVVSLASNDQVPILGKTDFDRESRTLRFTPRFPFGPGTKLVIRIKNAEGRSNRLLMNIKSSSSPATHVLQVWPTADQLPANLLKFYVRFSAPMRQGNIYQHLSLKDLTSGKIVELPFLELEQELWSPDRQRLTLLLDPGRIKRGLKPREEMGPIFLPGHRYQFRISGQWPDDQGEPLKANYTKTFTALANDFQTPDHRKWKLNSPRADHLSPLEILFDKPLDAALASRVLEIYLGKRRIRIRKTEFGRDQQQAFLYPETAWKTGTYVLRIGSELEDLCGNRIGKAFDVNLDQDKKVNETEAHQMTFQVR